MRSPSLVPWLLLGVIALICYGSLYPFNFKPDAVRGGIAEALQQLSWARAGRGDRVSNVLLYVPLGFCLFLWLETRLRRVYVVIIAAFAGTCLSLCIEVAQVYLSARVPSLMDLALNALGTVLGGVGAVGWRGLSELMLLPSARGAARADRSSLVVMLLWLAWRFAPYVPHLNLGKLKSALQPLFHPQVTLPATLRYLVCWLVVAQLLFRWVNRQRSTEALLALIAAVLVGRLLVAEQAFIASELVALLLLLPALVLVNRLWSGPQSALLLIVFGALMLFERLAPFQFSADPGQFDLWPFLQWMHVGMPIDPASLFEKLFFFGALIWLLKDAGTPINPAIGCVTVSLLAIEVLQLWQPNGSGSITDPLLALAVGMLLRLADARPAYGRIGRR